jgi:hypothetical protein
MNTNYLHTSRCNHVDIPQPHPQNEIIYPESPFKPPQHTDSKAIFFKITKKRTHLTIGMMQAFFYHNNTTSPIGFQWSSRTWKPSQWFQDSIN